MRVFGRSNRQMFLDWRGYVVGTGLVWLALLLKYLTQPDIIATPNSLPYILAIIITAVYFGLGPAIFVSVLSVFTYNVFFVDPLNSLKLPAMQEVPMLLIFLIVGIAVSFLAAGLRHKSDEAVRESTLRKQHEAELIKYRDHLETLVQQRTIELEKTREELEAKVKERTAELAESEEQYRLLVENASEAVIVIQDGIFKFFNNKTLEISGYSREELSSKLFSEFIHPDDRYTIIKRYQKRIRGENLPDTYEFRMVLRDGSIRWAEIHAVSINWESKPSVFVLLTDITERKNMEQELKAYAQRITQVQEEERKRIAYELHDDTAQYLSILKLQLDSLLKSEKIQDTEILEKLKYLTKDADRAFQDVRRYSHELRPGILDYLGLRAALDQIAEDINKLLQITVELKMEGEEPELSDDMKLGLFRIAQEAINNSRKHANASKVTINLKYSKDRVQMTVSDNGTGFNIQEVKARKGIRGNLGFVSMQERAKLMGGDLKIESIPNQGTTVSIEVPL